MNHAAAVAIAAADIAALYSAAGMLTLLAWAVRADSPLQRAAWTTWTIAVCLAVLVGTTLLLLLQRSHVLSDLPYNQLWPVLPDILRQTHFGAMWVLRGAAILAAAAAWGLLRKYPGRRIAAVLVLLAVVAFTRSATGHSADQGDWTVPELVDWLHILSGIVWAGAVVAAAWLWLPRALPEGGAFPRMAQGLSQLATVGLFGVAASGTYLAWTRLDRLDDLWSTPYGRHLVWKLALVGGMVALGATNRFFYLPRLTAADPAVGIPQRRFLCNLYVEAGVALAVFIAAAILINTQPPHMAMPSMGGMAM